MNLQPEELVECINVGKIPGAASIHLHLLTLGQVYTIREVVPAMTVDWQPRPGVILYEVHLPCIEKWEPAWDARRFRPIRKPSIDGLKRIADLAALDKFNEQEQAKHAIKKLAEILNGR